MGIEPAMHFSIALSRIKHPASLKHRDYIILHDRFVDTRDVVPVGGSYHVAFDSVGAVYTSYA
jgi:hypothetical protein